MFKFAHPEILYILILLPVFVVVYLVAINKKRRALKAFGDSNVIKELMPFMPKSKPHWKFFLLSLAFVFLIFGAAGPQFGSKLEEVKREGIEVIIALDVSNSMLAEDIKPNRLERAKLTIERLIELMEDDKVGLVVFAGDAYVQVPITSDYISAKMFLEGINTKMVSKQGTAIGSAIELASKSFSPQSEASKVIIVITDGENHEGNAIEMAEKANENGIKIYTIGLGSPQGVPIPVTAGQNVFRKDNDGNVIISKLDESTLNKIAASADGKYYNANSFNQIFAELDNLKTEEFETRVYTEYENRFQYLLAAGLLLLLIEIFILERKSPWVSRLNLFNEKQNNK
jgi:Ca-activated chloride channel family protein